MPKFEQPSHVKGKLCNYLPAIFRETKSCRYIEYYVENPNSQQLERMRIKVTRIFKRFSYKKDAKVYINEIIVKLNMKLSNGWNPFLSDKEDSRLYTNANEVVKRYIEEKEKELRAATLKSYKSICSLFLNWLNANFKGKHSGDITMHIATRFMDYVYMERNVGIVSYNNYIKHLRCMFEWWVEKCYIKSNPFKNIKLKKRPKKKRTIVDLETRKKISDYLLINEPNFLLVLKLIYNALIRPKEIRFIKIEYINIEKHYIRIPSDVAKNHNERFATVTESIIAHLKEMNIEKYPKDYYLFGGDLKPNKNPHGISLYKKHWDRLKKHVKIPDNVQLYSFRDTGIFDMLKSGIDDLSVMQHADHHSLEMTTRYANHHDPNLVNKIYENAPEF